MLSTSDKLPAVRRFIGIILLTFAIAQLGYRGVQRVRSDVPLWDFASVYSSSRAMLLGRNPYDPSAIARTWREQGFFANRNTDLWAAVYPPCSLIAIAPFAAMPARAGMIAWLFVLVALLVLQFLALADLARLKWRDPRALILVAAALASAPLQFGILSGQLSLPAISLCIIAFWCVAKDRNRLAGVLMGIACAIKPQIAAPFIAFYFVRQKRATADYAILVAGAIFLISLITMQLKHIDWIAGWSRALADSTRIGGVNDYSVAGKFRDEIVDLKLLLATLPQSALFLRIVVECAALALLGWFINSYARVERRSNRTELLALASLSALLLLPIYHRVYDATLLTLALAWALAEMDGKWRHFARALFFPAILLLVPFDLVQSVGNHLPNLLAIARTDWWQAFIAPTYAWGLLGMTLVLLATMHRQATAKRAIALPSVPVASPQIDLDDDEEELLAH